MVPKTEYAPYFERYMQLSVLKDKTIIESLESAQDEFESVLRNLQIRNIVILMLQESGR